jgi:hypothetical protein
MSLKLVLGIIAAAYICAVTKASFFACAAVAVLVFIVAFFGGGNGQEG